MGLGTAVTVAAIASLAVAAKAAAARFAAARAGYGVLVLRGIEVGAALLVTAFGALLSHRLHGERAASGFLNALDASSPWRHGQINAHSPER